MARPPAIRVLAEGPHRYTSCPPSHPPQGASEAMVNLPRRPGLSSAGRGIKVLANYFKVGVGGGGREQGGTSGSVEGGR